MTKPTFVPGMEHSARYQHSQCQ